MSEVKKNEGLSQEEQEALINTLRARFKKNKHRHEALEWEKVEAKLKMNPEKLWSLNEMERTEGEPDVVGYDEETDEFLFYDCSKESPKGRRSICYDRKALDARKKHKPENSAMDMAAEMGIEMLTEEEYRTLQELENFDMKTST